MVGYTVSQGYFILIYLAAVESKLLLARTHDAPVQFISASPRKPHNLWKQIKGGIWKNAHFRSRFEAAMRLNLLLSRLLGALRAACIWFHREVVNMPAFSTSLLFRHAQLRQSSSKVSAWGCGHCRSAFTHTQTYTSRVSAHNTGGCYCQCPLAGLREKRWCNLWVELGRENKVVTMCDFRFE